jgi:hypothetical protein
MPPQHKLPNGRGRTTMENMVKETGTRRTHVAQYLERAGCVLIIVETNVPGVYYVIEECSEVRQPVRVNVRVYTAREIWEKHGIDLYSHLTKNPRPA